MDKKDEKKKEKLNPLPAKKMASNRDYTIVINDFGELYGWGNNRDGRLGFKEEGSDLIDYPRKYGFFINKYMKLIDVACGNFHILVIACDKEALNSDGGILYVWGLDIFGRLGYISETKKSPIGEEEEFKYKPNPIQLKFPDKVTRVVCGSDFSACLTIKGHVYTWGTNRWGNLGIDNPGFSNDQYVVRTPSLITSLINKFIIQVSCGSKHMMVLSSDRKVYSWGSGEYGILGHGNENGINKPQLIMDLFDHEIIFITCGEFNSGAINSTGRLFLWGNGKFGRLGIGSEENQNRPMPIIDSIVLRERIFYLSIGYYHTLCCSVDGKTFSWGFSENGRLGCIEENECEQKKKILTPREITKLTGNKISQVFAGHHHSLAISLTGKIWGWGQNVNRVLGFLVNEENENKKNTAQINDDAKSQDVNNNSLKKSKKATIIYQAQELTINKNILKITGGVTDLLDAYFINSSIKSSNAEISLKCKLRKIACGGTHTLAITNTWDVLSWGFGTFGQLGVPGKKSLPIPTLINFGKDLKFRKIYCGYAHSMAIAKGVNQVYTWGDGSKGQLGKRSSEINDPSEVDDLTGIEILTGACGHDYSACITKDGSVYIWGSNTNSKLGIDSNNLKEDLPRQIEIMVNVKKISLGQNHVAVINSNGELYTWGHGYYGQLGHGDYLSVNTPKKVELMDIKFSKVKCGSFQTIIMDRKDIIYICGRGLMNLSPDADKHKSKLEVIEDLKSTKGMSIQAGYGNSLCLTPAKELYGFGDNDCIKAGGEFNEKNVVNNPKSIKFENGSKIKVRIDKIFCSFNHCFAISSTGEIYGWGNPKNFRLSSEFGDLIPKTPKLLNINWKVEKVVQQEKDPIITKAQVDERQLIEMLKSKNKTYSIKEVFFIIESLEKKYDDEKLKEIDKTFQNLLINSLKSMREINVNLFRDHYISVLKLQTMRFRQIGAPKKIQMHSQIPQIIRDNYNEIENVFTLFYLHPCNYLELVEGLQSQDYQQFINGIKFLYKDLSHNNKKSESFDNMLLLSTFRILVDNDLNNLKDLETLFINTSISELFLELYFYNTFNRSILIDIFENTIIKVFEILIINSKLNTNLNTINTLRTIVKDPNKLSDKDVFKTEHIDDLISISTLMVKDIESQISKIPIYVCYMIKHIQLSIKKELVKRKSDSKELQKLKLTVYRLLFKNIISNLLKTLMKNNGEYLKQLLFFKEDKKKSLENYLILLGEILDRIVLNQPISKITETEIDRRVDEAITMINEVIKNYHVKLFEIFKTKILKVRFDFKAEIISSIIYSNAEFKIKKFQIDLGSLIDFFKICNKKRNKIFTFFTQMKVLDMFEINGNVKYNYTISDTNQKLSFFIDVRHLIDPRSFVLKQSNYVKVVEKDLKDIKIGKCKKCYVILPQPFLTEEFFDVNIIKSFEQKVKNKIFFQVCEILNHPLLEKDNYETIEQLNDALKKLAEKLEEMEANEKKKENEKNENSEEEKEDENSKSSENDKHSFIDDVNTLIRFIEEEMNKPETEAFKLQSILSEIYKHIHRKIKHYAIMVKAEKLLNDVPDAKEIMKNKLNLINDDLMLAKSDLKEMKTSIELIDNKIQKEQFLTHKKIKELVDYNLSKKSEDELLRYRMLEVPISEIFQQGVIIDYGQLNEEKSNIILQFSNNSKKKFFDLKLNLKRSKELVKACSFTYEDYMYYSLYSNCFSILNLEGFGKFNATLFFDMIHHQLMDN